MTTQVQDSRERARRQLERKLRRAIQESSVDADSVFRLTLEEGEKAHAIRRAFERVKQQTGANDVGLVTHRGVLYIGQMPQRRGRGSRGR